MAANNTGESAALLRRRQHVISTLAKLASPTMEVRTLALDQVIELSHAWIADEYATEKQITHALGQSWLVEIEKDLKDRQFRTLAKILGVRYATKLIHDLYYEQQLGTRRGVVTKEQDLFEQLFLGLSLDPLARLSEVNDKVTRFKDLATGHLRDALNAYLETQNPVTYDEKRAVAELINNHLDHLGVSILHKDEHCRISTTIGKEHPTGRFLIVPRGSQAPVKTRVNLQDLLPIELSGPLPLTPPQLDWRGQEEARRLARQTRENGP